ncbi:coiled-coil domain-containing protein 25 [Orycteropus afer afer]|uniref:Coiled-coil domain-containing protein 25 n=1 Tax=Orycteropus afer afer TaxID=1230840 RepID=A0AC54Z9S4_ORYAF|nr:coiled-coil domain-containing protein 25 [Orycteropus afer afer]
MTASGHPPEVHGVVPGSWGPPCFWYPELPKLSAASSAQESPPHRQDHDEDLIKYGWPEDVWFHVDKLSSAHVYLRLHKGEKIEDIPKEVLMDCAHLVKANSIQGCKMNNVNVVYTPWSNLKKTADMDVGQIGFHRQKDVKIVTVEKKMNEILNRLEKTKMERFPDLAAEKECRDREERNEKKAQIQEMKRKEKEEMKKKREMDELRSYSSLMKVENMSSNQGPEIFDQDEAANVKTCRNGLIDVCSGSGPVFC